MRTALNALHLLAILSFTTGFGVSFVFALFSLHFFCISYRGVRHGYSA